MIIQCWYGLSWLNTVYVRGERSVRGWGVRWCRRRGWEGHEIALSTTSLPQQLMLSYFLFSHEVPRARIMRTSQRRINREFFYYDLTNEYQMNIPLSEVPPSLSPLAAKAMSIKSMLIPRKHSWTFRSALFMAFHPEKRTPGNTLRDGEG